MTTLRPAFDALVIRIHDLAAEALECGLDELHHLREIVSAAEDARLLADDAINAIYHSEGQDAGRACVRILKRQVQVDISAIRSRFRFVSDPVREAQRFEGRTWDLAAQGLASTDSAVQEQSRKTLAGLRGES